MTQRQYVTALEFRALPLGVRLTLMEDEQLNGYLQMATEKVEDYCNRIFSSAYYEEVFVGDASKTHLVDNYPLISVLSLVEKQATAGQDDRVVDVDTLRTTTVGTSIGRIEFGNVAGALVTFFDPTKTYTLNYRAGFETIPWRVKQATNLWTAELLGPDYWAGTAHGVDLMPLSSEQIIELLEKLRNRRYIW